MGLRCADSSFDILQRAAHHLRCHRVNLTTLQGRILGFAWPRASSRFVGNGEFFSKMACAANGASIACIALGSLRYNYPSLRAAINPQRTSFRTLKKNLASYFNDFKLRLLNEKKARN